MTLFRPFQIQLTLSYFLVDENLVELYLSVGLYGLTTNILSAIIFFLGC